MNEAHFKAYGIVGIDFTTESLSSFISSLSSATKGITVHINSEGGFVEKAFEMRDLLRGCGKYITTISEGKCYSAAPIIFASGDTRIATNDSVFMLHAPWIQPGADARFTGDEMLSHGSELKAIENKMAMTLVNATGASEEKIKEAMGVETFLTPEQAKDLQIVTQIVAPLKAMAMLTQNKNSNPTMSKITEMFSELKALLSPKAETAPTPEPTVEPVVAVAEPTLEEKFAALELENAELKKKLQDQEAEVVEAVAEFKTKYEALAKSIKSDHTIQTGGTDLSRTQGAGQPVNRVAEAKAKYGTLKKVK